MISPPASELSFSGVVLAGGRSSRMGRNKALLEVAGVPLWKRQLRLLEEAGAKELWVSLRAEDDWLPSDIPVLRDDGVAGPLGGLVAALDASRQAHVAVLAVDLPHLPTQWLTLLTRSCAPGQGAVGWRSEAAAYEPLAAVYPRELLETAQAALAAGKLSLQTLVRRGVTDGVMKSVEISTDQAAWFTNWNTPEDVVGE